MGAKEEFPLRLTAKLAGWLPDGEHVTNGELGALRALHAGSRMVRRGHHIVAQGRDCSGVWLLADGFALRYKVLNDGRRQVFHVALPGDMLGYPACFFERALYSVVALTDTSVCPLAFAELAALFRAHPRLAMALFWSSAGETAMFGERLAAIGRRGACERVAHFILEMAFRLRAVGIGDGTSFHMPLTQEQIADVLGLSAPHVNRMLRRLREDGLIDVEESRIRLIDRGALAALADFDDAYLAPRGARQADAFGAPDLPQVVSEIGVAARQP
ncbi:MAG TPA: Crp/Fnr family transcriptional regulator [Burkholderiales bacterium]|nr:Crp/Fnr family transcriptional regulator [Burkholderiales bacterium]